MVKKASGAFRRVVRTLRLQIALLIFHHKDYDDDDDDDDGDDDDYDDDADDQMFTQTYSRLILDMII